MQVLQKSSISKQRQTLQSSKGKFLEAQEIIRNVFPVNISKIQNTILTWDFLPSAPKLPQQPSHPHPKPKTTRSPTAPQTERGKCVGPVLRIPVVHPSRSYRKYNDSWGSIAQAGEKERYFNGWSPYVLCARIFSMVVVFLAMLVVIKCPW